MRLRNLISIAAFVAVAAIAVVISGCGSSSNDNTTQASATQSGGSGGGGAYGGSASGASSANTSSASGSTVDVGNTDLGKILVDSKGMTLYLFEADKPNMSNCSGACQNIWTPLMSSGKATAGSGVNAGMIGSTAQGQVTYNSWPLYTYAGDQKPGDTNGQNLDQFGAEWYVLSPAGDKVEG
jgi:predicted lipoprotein with Yx(FWY)xxD motif